MTTSDMNKGVMLVERTNWRGHLDQTFELDPNLIIYQEFKRLYGDERAERFRQYRELYEHTKKTRSKTAVPLHINLAMIDACQMLCPHCYRQHNPTHYDKKRLTWEECKSIIDECAALGVPSMFFGSGSELFLHKNGMQALEYATSKGIMDVFICSNGELMTPDITDRIIAAGVTRANISLDAATPETFAKVRGKGYEKILENLDYLIARKKELNRRLPILRVSFVNYHLNRHEKEMFIEKWRGKADIVDIQRPMDIKIVDSQPHTRLDDMPCTYPWEMMMINWDGNIMPCCNEFSKYVTVGNIANRGILEAWNSPEMEALRRSFIANDEGVPRACINCMKCLDDDVEYDPIPQ
jgi:radical SAM protein with 4Fe4S-binding SPASM domain